MAYQKTSGVMLDLHRLVWTDELPLVAYLMLQQSPSRQRQMLRYQDSGTCQRCHTAGSPWVVVAGTGSGFEKVGSVTLVCCVHAYATEGPKARLENLCWHSEERSDNHHRDVGYARRAVDTANMPAS